MLSRAAWATATVAPPGPQKLLASYKPDRSHPEGKPRAKAERKEVVHLQEIKGRLIYWT